MPGPTVLVAPSTVTVTVPPPRFWTAAVWSGLEVTFAVTPAGIVTTVSPPPRTTWAVPLVTCALMLPQVSTASLPAESRSVKAPVLGHMLSVT